MWRKVINWLHGYLYVRIRGKETERFINLCCNKRITIWNLRGEENELRFQIRAQDYKKLKLIAKKTGIIPGIIGKAGMPFYLIRYRKKKAFFAGMAICIFMVYIMSLYIWDIQVEGGYKYTPETMLHFLKENKITAGIRKSRVACQEIEENIRLAYKDIGWVSAEIKGTRLRIKLTETNMPAPAKVAIAPSHMIATRNSIIQEIITRAGVPMVKEGDTIKKGDILVSGLLAVKGDFDEILRYQPVIADATIRSKTYYDYKDAFSINYTKKVFTGKEKKSFYLTLFNKKIFLNNPIYFYPKYDIIVNEHVFHITDTFYLPIRCGLVTRREYHEERQIYTQAEVVFLAKERAHRYLERLEEKGAKVIKENIEFTIENKKCIASGRIIVEEPAWEYRKIQENEWRIEQTDEHN